MSLAAPLLKPFVTRPARPAARPKRATSVFPRPRLVIAAPARPSAHRVAFFLLVGAVLVTGLITLLLLHTMAAQDGFRVSALQTRLATLTDTEQQLERHVQADASPSRLAARAKALGMVPTVVTKFHKLHDGRAVGVQTPVAAVAPVTTTVTTATTTSAGAAHGASAGAAHHASAGAAHHASAGAAQHHPRSGTSKTTSGRHHQHG